MEAFLYPPFPPNLHESGYPPFQKRLFTFSDLSELIEKQNLMTVTIHNFHGVNFRAVVACPPSVWERKRNYTYITYQFSN